MGSRAIAPVLESPDPKQELLRDKNSGIVTHLPSMVMRGLRAPRGEDGHVGSTSGLYEAFGDASEAAAMMLQTLLRVRFVLVKRRECFYAAAHR